MLESDEHYRGREQTRVKHEVLRQYLESFAHIVAFKWPSITYIDGFSGPWNAQSADFKDTSFWIALNELRRARETHAAAGRQLRIRCVFVEKDRKAYQLLKEFANSNNDAQIKTIQGEFEPAISEIIGFVKEDPQTFPFTFIDPTGSSGFAMNVIAPLLKMTPGEALINFMLEFTRRYIAQPELRKNPEELFGTSDFDKNLADLTGIDRDDAIIETYCSCLSRSCNYPFVTRASVLHRDRDRLYFQLIYATRHPKGVKAFKNAERKAMQAQEKGRARIEEEERAKKAGGQKSFLDPADMPESAYYTQLRQRHLTQARNKVVSMINGANEVGFDQLWLAALSYPMVWESDLKNWLQQWLKTNSISWQGQGSRERAFKQGHTHVVVRKADRVQ